jgi:arylsulfatase A-like enzyme
MSCAPPRRATRRRCLPIPALLALVLAGCGPTLPPTRGVLLISIDTLRADRLGCYGNPRDTSPFLDSLAARGVLFERLIAQYPSTLTSHMSIFTGLYPQEHAVFPPDGELAAAIPTLPELLRRGGYRTGGFTEAGLMRGSHGFARGFDRFDDRSEDRFDDLERTLARGLDFLRALPRDERFFLFLHTYAVHTPYDPPPPYDSMYWSAPPPPAPAPTGRSFLRINSHKLAVEPEALEYYKALYDGSIRYVDDRLRQFFGELESLGLADDLTVIVTSDHGEEFFEHGQLAHSQIYPETMHVPLVVVHPALRGPRRVPDLVETVDLAPTLLELAGVAPPEVSGRTLLPLLAGSSGSPRGHAYSEVSVAGLFASSLRSDAPGGRYQIVRTRIDPSQPRERITAFDVGPSELPLEVESFLERPRRLEIRVDGEPHSSVALAGGETGRIVLPAAPGSRRRRVRIEADSCTPRDRRRPHVDCYSYVLSAPRTLERYELFELADDPLAQRDVWATNSALGRRLLAQLSALRWTPRGASSRVELDDEARRQLEALGYL